MAILSVRPLDFVWVTQDPFLFCVHHLDAYPKGNAALGPAASLAGRNIGQDFEGVDGWRMYHGTQIPGFPQHPHRGFETVTIMRQGVVDHSDSLGATARFGPGDVQWLTAGKGIVHCEMFPLLSQEKPNPLELFQIWLNLPAEDKMVEPHFSMLWGESIPRVEAQDAEGRRTEITVVAGRLGDAVPPAPPPRSWASRPESDLAIWSIRMEPGARWTLPPALAGGNRTLYLFGGAGTRIAGRELRPKVGVALDPSAAVELHNGAAPGDLLLLQARPIGQPVAQYGPFVMNTNAEIQQAFADYRRTRFGGWPWGVDGPVHAREKGRFALHPGGHTDTPPEAAG